MTNAEKYLKDGVSIEEFARIILEETTFDPRQEDIIAFLNKPYKLTLTEDERVILRNIKDFIVIGRREDGRLYCDCETGKGLGYFFDFYSHLFQFIKERRRILY